MNELKISKVEILPINPIKGLVGFASCVINDCIFIGDIGIHQRLDGTVGLAFPKKKLPNGVTILCVNPITKEAGETITKAIVDRYNELLQKVSSERAFDHEA